MGPARSVAVRLEIPIAPSGGSKSLIFLVFYNDLTIWPTKGGQGTPRAPQGIAKTSPRYSAELQGTLQGLHGTRSAAVPLEILIALGGGPKSLIFLVFYSYLTIWPTKGGQGTPRAPQGTAKTSPRYPAEPQGTLKGPRGTSTRLLERS